MTIEAKNNNSCSPAKNLLENLINYINNSKLNVGDKLPAERTLANNFSVSRGTLRKAITKLSDMGLLESRQGDGTYIAKFDITKDSELSEINAVDTTSLFEQILEFRYIFEPAVAALAAQKRTQEDINKLKVIACDQQKRIFLGEGDGNLDAEFHLQLAKSTQNRLFVETMEKINSLYEKGREDNLRDNEWIQFSVSCHMRIIDALEHQDAQRCYQEVSEHIKEVNAKHLFNVGIISDSGVLK